MGVQDDTKMKRITARARKSHGMVITDIVVNNELHYGKMKRVKGNKVTDELDTLFKTGY